MMEDLDFLKEKLKLTMESKDKLDSEILYQIKSSILELVINTIKLEKGCDQIQSIIDKIEDCDECEECDDE